VCGDENLDEGEECDDGNNVDGDGCSAECTIEESGCAQLAGILAFAVSVAYDASGHDPFIGMPGTFELAFEVNGIAAVTGSAPFVDVTGTTSDGSIAATGSGVVAGYPDIDVELTCDCAQATCTYRMGVSGGLPGGDEIVYSLEPL
jgi:cysteine-rich repeat protein